MEFEINTGVCSNCNFDKCERGCLIHTGKALRDFLDNVDMVETIIGDYSSSTKGGKQDLVYSGYQMFNLNEPINVLTAIKTQLDVTDKFARAYDKTAFQILKEYLNEIKEDKSISAELLDKLVKLNKNRLIIVPIKPHSECRLNNINNDEELEDQQGKILYLKWSTNQETHKLECKVAIKFEGKINDKVYKFDISEYNDKFRLSALDVKMLGNKQKNKFIKMHRYGIIHPIEIVDGNYSIIVDGTYIYYCIANRDTIIGQWNTNGSIDIAIKGNNILKSKAYEKLKKNIEFIASHRKYIAPYKLLETHKVELK